MNDVIDILESEVLKNNTADFIKDDPVQFPRLFTDLRDIEIVSLLISSIAWGNRKMILNNSRKLLSLMDHQPYNFLKDEGFEELPDDLNIHRTFFARNLKHYLRGLKAVYDKYPSVNEFVKTRKINLDAYPAWKLAAELNDIFSRANEELTDSRCIPANVDTTALKRLNMALRWLVRNDGKVDLGVWDCLKPSQLFIPLDVHVGNVSRALGLIERKANDKKTVIDLTEKLRTLNSEDPVKYDFALFGLGVYNRLS